MIVKETSHLFLLKMEICLPFSVVVPGLEVEGRGVDGVGVVTSIALVTVVKSDEIGVVCVLLVNAAKRYGNNI